jgi:hypothetical protein
MLMGAPVWGLRPLRASRLTGLNVPKPTSVTESPFAMASLIDDKMQSTAACASFFVLTTFATSLTKSFLFNFLLLSLQNRLKKYTLPFSLPMPARSLADRRMIILTPVSSINRTYLDEIHVSSKIRSARSSQIPENRRGETLKNHKADLSAALHAIR